jgi:multiple sugar transport system ATP-binding protein
MLGIRPEHLRIAQPTDEYTLQGQVFSVENLGMYKLCSIQIIDRQGAAIVLRSLLPPTEDWINQTITLAVSPNSLHWFNVESGEAFVE